MSLTTTIKRTTFWFKHKLFIFSFFVSVMKESYTILTPQRFEVDGIRSSRAETLCSRSNFWVLARVWRIVYDGRNMHSSEKNTFLIHYLFQLFPSVIFLHGSVNILWSQEIFFGCCKGTPWRRINSSAIRLPAEVWMKINIVRCQSLFEMTSSRIMIRSRGY